MSTCATVIYRKGKYQVIEASTCEEITVISEHDTLLEAQAARKQLMGGVK